MKKKLFWVMVILFLGWSAGVKAVEDEVDYWKTQFYIQCTEEVQEDEGVVSFIFQNGSGTLYRSNGKCWVITAYHVVDNCFAELFDQSGIKYQPEEIIAVPDIDLAFIKISRELCPIKKAISKFGKFRFNRFNSQKLKVLSYPLNKKTFSIGQLLFLDQDFGLGRDQKINQGSSGAGVFYKNRYIGMITAILSEKESLAPSGIYLFLPAAKIESILEGEIIKE